MSQSSSTQGSPLGMEVLDFGSSGFDNNNYTSPDLNKAHFTPRPSATINTPASLPSNETMSGPSHQYDLYKQQTPFVPGAVSSTMAMNQSLSIPGYTLDYTNNDVFDFNAASLDDDMEMSSFYGQTIDPNSINAQDLVNSPPLPPAPSNVGRMYPGMHQEAAMQAKAHAQQRQQQQIMMQQNMRQQQQQMQQQFKPANPAPRSKSQATDPLVEMKITQLLQSMRNKAGESGDDDSPLTTISKMRKDEEDMDEDERLLASEEGKKLSSKERRQLRNKVSARAFRSRRKEYIGQLEGEIASKVSQNSELMQTNKNLMEENRRLSELTRTLLSSSHFAGFLDQLSNPNQLQQQTVPIKAEPQHNQLPQQQQPQPQQQQQIGIAMLPEQNLNFNSLNIEGSSANFYQQPRVYAVLETPEVPEIDTSVLSGKTSESVGEWTSETKDVAALELPCFAEETESTGSEAEVSTSHPANLDGDIYDDEPEESASSPLELNIDLSFFAGMVSEKGTPRYELVDASIEEEAADAAVRRVNCLSAKLESTLKNLERMTGDL